MTERPGKSLPPVDLETTRQKLAEELDAPIDDDALNGYLMYPKVCREYMERKQTYDRVSVLPTLTFFYGMQPGEEISVELDLGKTLEIRFLTMGETDTAGNVKAFFELNGQPRVVRVPDRTARAVVVARPKVQEENSNHIGAPMPGSIAGIHVTPGQKVKPGDLLVTMEAMKMETGLHADKDAVVKEIHVTQGSQVEAKDLLVELQ